MTAKKETVKHLYRSEHDRVLAGIAGGLGEYFTVDSMLFRLLFIIFSVFGGSGIILYIILWIMLPSESDKNISINETVKKNTQELKIQAGNISAQFQSGHKKKDKSCNGRMIFGTFLFIIGVLFLLQNFGYIQILHFFKLWPLILIAVALSMIL